ncbi:hypothetical protein LIPSTDRAFT_73694 [Lipomyces starkeyi NRRL Y-11557]|uniref:Uncharacterized protein n=1 Tax=Lipomyces starkeyi NRRL Y-11557 TaxID=675824 RepID=A0A1E3Q0F1_LIPST|nr:hypothetical protein LIPSTDRAFT_73694 [Lipomyces starkeyi NRRL Y-11557]
MSRLHGQLRMNVLSRKGRGTGLMVSDFYCPCHGSLQLESAIVRIIKEPEEPERTEMA